MTRRLYVLSTRDKRKSVAAIVAQLPQYARVEIKDPKRTLPQNDLMWAWLTAYADQATYYGEKMSDLDWKDLFSAAVKIAANNGRVRAVPGLEGGIVLLGTHTSDMSVSEMADMITYMESKSAEYGVSLDDDGKGASGANNPARDAA